jgi:hypothetical protein
MKTITIKEVKNITKMKKIKIIMQISLLLITIGASSQSFTIKPAGYDLKEKTAIIGASLGFKLFNTINLYGDGIVSVSDSKPACGGLKVTYEYNISDNVSIEAGGGVYAEVWLESKVTYSEFPLDVKNEYDKNRIVVLPALALNYKMAHIEANIGSGHTVITFGFKIPF